MSVAKHGKTIQKAVVSGCFFNFVGSNRIPYSATTIYIYVYIYIRNCNQIYTYICSYTVSYINHIYMYRHVLS